MSTLSFKAFCIEYYAAHIGRPSNEVYALFERTGLLNLLDEDYEDLHGMSMEYLMQFFDRYLEGAALFCITEVRWRFHSRTFSNPKSVVTLVLHSIPRIFRHRLNAGPDAAP